LVLVVDDQARNLQQVKKVLSCDGFHVVTAESGEEAFRCLAARKPDLILLDVMMPGMDGFEVCAQIKSNPASRDIPIIFLSGDTEHQSVMTGFAKGGVDYIRKPFNKAELLARVRTHVELCRSQLRHEKQLQEKQRTLDLIAHEWHKPLQRIALILSKIKELGASSKSDVVGTLGVEAAREMDRMLTSVENFLHHESPDNGTPVIRAGSHLTSNDLKSMAGKWYVTAKRKLIDLQLSAPAEPVALAGPPFAINQIVDAMLSNAVNFTPQNGRIEVRIARDGDRVCLKVEDDGPGFSTEYLRRKFQPYLRVTDGAPLRGSSLGVGLAAAKRIADRIDAKLTVANKGEKGAIVTVEFAKKAEG
jgi:two-component system sensor histidine kinase/response regulator